MEIALGLILLAAIIVVGYVIGIYNGLVRGRNETKNAFSQIDVQLKRRFELIPNLVETAKGYMKHERETLEAVIRARNQASAAIQAVGQNPTNAAAMKELMVADQALTQGLGKIFALAEAYPDLKANTTMNHLIEELTSTENKVSFARQAYNDSVMNYNNQIEVFPNVIFAGMFQFKPGILFEIQNNTERDAVRVSFTS